MTPCAFADICRPVWDRLAVGFGTYELEDHCRHASGRRDVAVPVTTSATVSFWMLGMPPDSINIWRALYEVHGWDVTFTHAMSAAVGAAPGQPVIDALFGATGARLKDRPVHTHGAGSRLTMTVSGYSLRLERSA
jgi:hypothetical protein